MHSTFIYVPHTKPLWAHGASFAFFLLPLIKFQIKSNMKLYVVY